MIDVFLSYHVATVLQCHSITIHFVTTAHYKKLSYRKQTTQLLHNTEIRVLHKSHIVLMSIF